MTGASLPIKFLNINRTITCLATGPVREHSAKDALLVGTPTNVLAYDVQDNSDLFFKEVPDGVQRVVFGEVQGIASPITIVGGTCSILGFDSTGEEVFWTVTGDVVSAMAFQDVSGDGRAELLVGSEDYEIRAFQGDDVFWEITETDKVRCLPRSCNFLARGRRTSLCRPPTLPPYPASHIRPPLSEHRYLVCAPSLVLVLDTPSPTAPLACTMARLVSGA